MNRTLPWLASAVLALALGGCGIRLDGPTDWEAAQAVADDLRAAELEAFHAALAQQQSQRPDLWTAEQRERADVAAGVIARGDVR